MTRAVEIFERKGKYMSYQVRDRTIKVNIQIGENRKPQLVPSHWEGHTKPVVALSHFVASHDCIVSASNDKPCGCGKSAERMKQLS